MATGSSGQADPETRMILCDGCGAISPARLTDDGLLPMGAGNDSTCVHCGGAEFSPILVRSEELVKS